MKKALALSGAFLLAVACNNNPQKEEKKEKPKLGFDLSNLDTTVSPCQDFFQYVAGGWVKNNPIPPTESRWGNFNILVQENNKKVRGILDSIQKVNDLKKGSYGQLVGDFYKSGMDSMAVENAGTKPLQPLLDHINSVSTYQDFNDLMTFFALHNMNAPFVSGVNVDDKNSQKYVFTIAQGGLGLPDRDYYLKKDSTSENVQNKYREHIAKMLELAGEDAAKAASDAQAIYKFEYKLAEKQMSRQDQRQVENVYNKLSRQEIVNDAKDLDMDNYLNALNISFDSAIVNEPDYIKAIDKIIPSTPLETLKAYARWQAVQDAAGYLPHAFVQESFNFYGKVLQGNKELKPRWRRTLNNISSGLGEQMGHLFVDKYFPESSKEKIQQMVEDLRTAYKQRIEQLDWMSDSTKQRALEKLKAFSYKIGYPDKWKDYSDLDIKVDDYYGNGDRLSVYSVKRDLKKLGKPVDRKEWYMPAYIVNAYNSSSFNEVVFPAGILQPPFYNPDADDAINYGAIGGVIGHEFTHGFDDQGRKYNGMGNLDNWWTAKDMENFEQRTGRMVSQFGSYQPLHDVFVNGKLTLGENIADLGGLTLGYYAYKISHVDGKDSVPPVIDGYSWQQRIFLGWGQVWQAAQTDESLRQQVVTDPHSPARFRVNGPMSNMPEFKEAWGCSAGDAMVRPDSVQVRIW